MLDLLLGELCSSVMFQYLINPTILLTFAEVAGISVPIHHSIVGVLPQPCSHGNRQENIYSKVFQITFMVLYLIPMTSGGIWFAND